LSAGNARRRKYQLWLYQWREKAANQSAEKLKYRSLAHNGIGYIRSVFGN
jgi:hypothetical protein